MRVDGHPRGVKRLDPTTARVLTGLAADVRRARLAMGLSQSHLARELNVSQSTVAHLERARLQNLRSVEQSGSSLGWAASSTSVSASRPSDPIVRDAAHARPVA